MLKRVASGKGYLALAVLAVGLGIGVSTELELLAQTAPATATATAPKVQANKAAAVEKFKSAKTLYDAGKLKEAQVENEAALALDPNFLDAKLLRKVLADKLAGETGGPDTTETGTAAGKVGLLNKDQMSLIRLWELADGEKGIQGSIDRKTIEEFWKEYMKTDLNGVITRQEYDKFISPNNFANQVAKIKESKLSKYMEKTTITSDPAAMVQFIRRVQPYVLQNCATATCHGGGNAGDFMLTGRANATVSPQQTYTNFYIMSHYVAKDGGKMINRDEPQKSLLLQYGIPKNVAFFPHPGKVEVRRFADENAEEAKQIVAWVKTLAFPKPNYGIVYEMPKAATQPATTETKPAEK